MISIRGELHDEIVRRFLNELELYTVIATKFERKWRTWPKSQ